METIRVHNLLARVCVLALALASIPIYWYCRVDEVSFSSLWGSPIQPLFIFVNISTSYYFFSTEKWMPSAIMLLLLTAFPVESYYIAHNVFATSFFVYSAIPIAADKRLKIYIIPYIASVLFIKWPDIYLMETIAIATLSLFHMHNLYMHWDCHRKRKKLKEN